LGKSLFVVACLTTKVINKLVKESRDDQIHHWQVQMKPVFKSTGIAAVVEFFDVDE